jgi:hypothetical protein
MAYVEGWVVQAVSERARRRFYRDNFEDLMGRGSAFLDTAPRGGLA